MTSIIIGWTISAVAGLIFTKWTSLTVENVINTTMGGYGMAFCIWLLS